MKFDQVNEKKTLVGLAPAVRSADASAEFDLQGFNAATFIVDMGAEGITLSGTDKIEIVVRHSDVSGSGQVAVAAADIILPATKPAKLLAPDANGIVAALTANADIPDAFIFGYRGSKRFVTVTLDYSGTHATGTPSAVTAILENPEFAPV